MATATINREEFLNKLQSVTPGLSQKEIIEQSSCFVFDEGYIMTFNEERACKIKSGLPQDFVGAVRSKPLLALLEKLTEETLKLESSDTELTVIGDKRRADLLLDAQIALDVNIEKPGKWKPLPDDFEEAVKMTASCAGTDDSRFSLTCVHITPDYMEACDDIQIMRYYLRMDVEPLLIHREGLKYVLTLGMIKFSETETWVHFCNANGLILSCRRFLIDDYPDLAPNLKVKGVPTIIPGGLSEAVGRAEIFSSEDADSNKILVELRSSGIRISGRGITGRYQEIKQVKYKGPPIAFYTAPPILTELAKKGTSCEFSDERLKVEVEKKYIYISCLSKVKNTKEEEAA